MSFGIVVWSISIIVQRVSKHNTVDDFKWDQQTLGWQKLPETSSRGMNKIYERRLTNEFRAIVREPLPDRRDPRFKTWDARGRFPKSALPLPASDRYISG